MSKLPHGSHFHISLRLARCQAIFALDPLLSPWTSWTSWTFWGFEHIEHLELFEALNILNIIHYNAVAPCCTLEECGKCILAWPGAKANKTTKYQKYNHKKQFQDEYKEKIRNTLATAPINTITLCGIWQWPGFRTKYSEYSLNLIKMQSKYSN